MKNMTQIPNVVLDRLMAELHASEFKTLMAILRQTIGWADRTKKGGRKMKDRLTVGRIATMTGCSRRAVSMALDVLLKKKLIVVTLMDGTDASEPETRQGRMLLIGPHADVLVQSIPTGSAMTEEVDQQPIPTTKENVLNKEKDFFSCEKSMQLLHDSSDRSLNVIAYWMERKKIRPTNQQQWDITIQRHQAKAKEVGSFSDKEIIKVCDRLDESFPDYTLNTILSSLTR